MCHHLFKFDNWVNITHPQVIMKKKVLYLNELGILIILTFILETNFFIFLFFCVVPMMNSEGQLCTIK
jgi:hypothetical protein